MDPVVHFELPAEDRERMAAFYTAAFGWQAQFHGPELGDYTVVTTTESEAGRPTTPGAINCGLFLRTSDPASHAPSVVIAVQDIHASLRAVEQAGGTVAGPPQEIPGVGTYAGFHDTKATVSACCSHFRRPESGPGEPRGRRGRERAQPD